MEIILWRHTLRKTTTITRDWQARQGVRSARNHFHRRRCRCRTRQKTPQFTLTKRMATDPKEHPTATDRRQLSPSDTPSFQTPGLFPDRRHSPSPFSTGPVSDDYSGTGHEDHYSKDPNCSTTSSTAYEISSSLPSTSAPSLSSLPDTTLSDITNPTSGGHPPSTTRTTLSSVPASVLPSPFRL